MRAATHEGRPSCFHLRSVPGSNRRVQKRVAAAADIDRLIRMTDRQRAGLHPDVFRVQLERSAPVSHADQFGIRRGLRHPDDRRRH